MIDVSEILSNDSETTVKRKVPPELNVEELKVEDPKEIENRNEITPATEEMMPEVPVQKEPEVDPRDKIIENQTEMIKELHGKLEKMIQNESGRFMEEVAKGLIKIRKSMKQNLDFGKLGEMSVEELAEEFQYLYEDITDFLEMRDIIPYRTKPGETVNYSIHRATPQPTSNENLDGTIAESIEEGFMFKGKPIIFEKVVVYQYKEEKTDAE